MTLIFNVSHQSLSLIPSQLRVKLASGSKKYLKAKFIFQTSEWKKEQKIYAIFVRNGKRFRKKLGEDGLGQYECYIEESVIKEDGFYISLCAGDLITTNQVFLPVLSSGLDVEEGEPDTADIEEIVDKKLQEEVFDAEILIDANLLEE